VSADRKTIDSAISGFTMTSGAIGGMHYDPIRMDPDVRVLKIGGQSILDRGRPALFPVLDEIVAAKGDHKILTMCGGGTRARHIYSIAAELELPTGLLAALGMYVPMQNARMVQMLLARHGGVLMLHDDFEKLPLYFRLGCLPVMTGMPPFGYWEKPTEGTRIPANRTDAGVFLSAEVLGVRRAIFVKDEDGLHTHDPKKDPGARFIARVGVHELDAMDLPDLVVERSVLEYLKRARHCHEVQVINGLRRGELTRALAGEDVGTIIYQDRN
jgi:molybdenum storage protein